MANSSIEWTEKTWNPLTGCTRISEGCRNCYAEVMSQRLANMGQKNYLPVVKDWKWTNKIQLVPKALPLPAKWKKGCMIFVNSMSDLFHQDVPLDYIKQVFKVMRENPQHIYQILTKRAERLKELSGELEWTDSIWMGVSVEDAKVLGRVKDLSKCGAAIKWLSVEPLIGPVGRLPLAAMDWIVLGGESGHGARPMHPDWVRKTREKCISSNTPFFFKQWGKLKNNPDKNDPTAKENGGHAKGGRMLDGRTWDEYPA